MELTDILKELELREVPTSISYSTDFGMLYINLDTRAKSWLYLYEDGTIRGRYDYENKIDFSNDISSIILLLCVEFSNSLHGKSYGNSDWFDLCNELEVKYKTGF